MRTKLFSLLIALLIALTGLSYGQTSGQLVPWTPEVSASRRHISLYQSSPDESVAASSTEAHEPFVVSPDGDYFFFVTRTGDLRSDTNIYELHVYRATDVLKWLASNQLRSPPRPFRLVVRRSSSSSPAISDARWGGNNRSIAFWGLDPGNVSQVFKFDLQTGQVVQMTRFGKTAHASYRWFEYSNGTLIHNGYQEKTAKARYPMETVPLSLNGAVRKPEETMRTEAIETTLKEVYVKHGNNQSRRLNLKIPDLLGASAFLWLSPDGRKLVIRDASNPDANRFVVLDTRTTRSDALLSTDVGTQFAGTDPVAFPKALWAPDSRSVVLVNTHISEKSDISSRVQTGHIVEYDTESKKWRSITPMVVHKGGKQFAVRSVEWMVPGKELLAKFAADRKPSFAVVFRIEANSISQKELPYGTNVPKSSSGALKIQMQQSANEPATITVSDGKREGVLLDHDPILASVRIAKQKTFTWSERGQEFVGGLTLPTDWSPDVRLPLVIQTYDYQPNVFLPDGANSTSDAAQALAARGIAVAQVPTRMAGLSASAEERKTEYYLFAERIGLVVQSLVADGIIDSNRVGLTGFSRMGYLTYWTITHPGRTQLAACIIADSYDGSYSSYVRDIAAGGQNGSSVRGLESVSDRGAFWQNKDKWLESETSFNIDRVRTPALFTANRSRAGNDDIFLTRSYLFLNYGGFLRNGKPMEMLLFPEGDHQLRRPQERLEMMTAVVDWYCFWLKGEIPPDPERAKRWDRLRNMQRAVLAHLFSKGERIADLPPLISAPSWVKALPSDSITASKP